MKLPLIPRVLLAALASASLVGCTADGPIAQLTSMNPLVRRQWREDERATTTFYQRMEQLKSMESSVARMSPEDQASAAQQLNSLVRSEANPILRAQAVRVLARTPHPAAEIGLNMAESDKDADVRQAICQVRGAQRSRLGLQALARILSSDEDLDVRMSAARELGNYRDPEAYRALGAALTDSDPALQNLAMASLARATGKNLGASVPAWEKYLASGEVEEPSGNWASIFKGWY